jgi:hypothetical protein
MKLDIGLVILVLSVLVFYLRLIILQRQRVKRVNQAVQPSRKTKKSPPRQSYTEKYSVISRNKRDWIIAGIGIGLIILGTLLNLRWLPFPLAQTYWWVPVSIGILLFSWGFK